MFAQMFYQIIDVLGAPFMTQFYIYCGCMVLLGFCAVFIKGLCCEVIK